MENVRYMISDAAAMAGVESHVLRYWEEELALKVSRNELGHRYYTRENIAEFLKIKELKEKGYQLRAIKEVLHNHKELIPVVLDEKPAADEKMTVGEKTTVDKKLAEEDKLALFTELMTEIVGHAIALNNEELSQQIGESVSERVLKEMDYLSRMQEDAAMERYHKLDAAIRGTKKKKSLFKKKQTEMLSHPQTV